MVIAVNSYEHTRIFQCCETDCPIGKKECQIIQDEELSCPILCIHSKNHLAKFHEMNWMQIGDNVIICSHRCNVTVEPKGNYLDISMRYENGRV